MMKQFRQRLGMTAWPGESGTVLQYLVSLLIYFFILKFILWDCPLTYMHHSPPRYNLNSKTFSIMTGKRKR